MKKIVLLIITVVAISSLVIVTCLSLKNNDSVESSSSLGGIISSESTQSPSSSAGAQDGVSEDILSNIQFNTLEVTGKNVYGVVSNSSDNYSFLEEISIEGTEKLKITHETIANHLGSHREVMTRMLKFFQNEGMVKLSRGMIEITDSEKLESLSDE